jgi:acetylornithine/succinyldiaminopimelate/putrescine aminotransferase
MPYVPAAANGPWIVSTFGSVVCDAGGYGMLSFGHNAPFLLDALNKPHCMANIMTASTSQPNFNESIRKHIGFSRKDKKCPYDKFMVMNSGSEAVELATRITDVHAKRMTAPGAPHAGWKTSMMCLEGSFYGRTYRPARLSHSCREIYQQHLASFSHPECHLPIVVPPNDVKALQAAFENAARNKIHIEALFAEPCLGEGAPGVVLNRDFYEAARELTRKHNSLLIIDSIQAGFRATGSLSVVDYPAFTIAGKEVDAPDMETYSKAVNGGQFPLSVLALRDSAASNYVTGLYGNTMTTNPRGLDVATALLKQVTPDVRSNIIKSGSSLQQRLSKLCNQYPEILSHVTGSGLIQAVHLRPKIPMMGGNHSGTPSFLARCRQNGLGIINAAHTVKFTPHFELSQAEIDLMVDTMDFVCNDYKKSEKL